MAIDRKEVEETLLRARKTVAAAKALMTEADLRIQETDRFLARQGLTREQVNAMQFTAEQKARVNEELVRRGFQPLEEVTVSPTVDAGRPAAGDERVTAGARQKRFGTFMQQFRI